MSVKTNGDGPAVESTKRLMAKKQTLDDAYAPPTNFLEIDVCNPLTHGLARNRFTDYEVKVKVNILIMLFSDGFTIYILQELFRPSGCKHVIMEMGLQIG